MTRTFFARPTGGFSRRLFAVRKIMNKRAASAIAAGQACADQNSPEAAALRGKARGYREAADLLNRLDKGYRLTRTRRWEGP